MDLKNLKIGTQLKLGFGVLLLFVIVLGMVAYMQTSQIQQQTETIYNHPLQVRLAIGGIRESIRGIQVEYRSILFADSTEGIQFAIQKSDVYEAELLRRFAILQEKYLGPKTDIENAFYAFVRWSSLHKNSRNMLQAEDKASAMVRLSDSGDIGSVREELFTAIGTIDEYALKKSDELYLSSLELRDNLHKQLLLLVAAIILLSFVISYIVSKNISKPLAELANATRRFHSGNLAVRSSYALQNEFGLLSDSFNILAESVQMNMELNEKTANLARLMLGEDDAKEFFLSTLTTLAQYTSSQIAAVYLLSDDKTTYEHFVSIGMVENAKQSFGADDLEGEFGLALASGKMQHIKNIPENTKFIFHSVAGQFFPREIITFPVQTNNVVIAVISLASVNSYENQAIQLLNKMLDTFNARTEGVLAYRKIKEFLTKLEQQNLELQTQESEMAAQSAELIQQNTELEMQKKQVDEANRLKTVFLSNMSHELRTPLNSVIVLSGVLNRRLAHKIPEEEYSYLEVIERNGKYLLALINDILDISRIESGREEIELTQFNVNSLIAEEVCLIHPQAAQKNIELLHHKKDTDIFITSDSSKCRHVLQNVISNAVKFTDVGKVEVTAEYKDSLLAITVTDTGIGISEKNLPLIFEEFRQADGSTSRRFGGTGLGLTIAKKYATLLGGSIAVKSALTKGSEFTITFPLHYDPEKEVPEAKAGIDLKPLIKKIHPIPASLASAKTILIVDDAEPVIIQMKDILGESGYQLQVARDGEEALKSITKTIPDAMILDLMMPGIDGFEVLRTLRNAEHTAHIPILVLTAKHITKEDLKFLKGNNIHQLIQKGDVRRNELLNAVTMMLFPEPEKITQPSRKRQVIAGKPVVLLVEDNPDNMLTAKALLADSYIVLEAADGAQGVEMAKQYNPNLILMDIELPGMNGVDALAAIRGDKKLQHTPVIALTASAMTYGSETILEYGFDAHLVKPIDESVFYKLITEALDGE